ncbi:MAG: tetratricopeptide repeat protein [Flavobacteriaceae bacterium]|nr:tetratricopeptide repeat protein [Flavobacteriaceae bacterium]
MKNTILLLLAYCYCIHFSFSQADTKHLDNTYQHALDLLKNQNQEEALQITLQEIDRFPTLHTNRAKWLMLTGDIFIKNNELDKAINYYKKSLSINLKLNDSLTIMEGYLKTGRVYQKKFRDLHPKFDSKKARNHKDSADFYYQKIITDYKSVTSGSKHLAQTYNNLAYMYSDINKLEKAQYYITEAINIYETKLTLPLSLNAALNNQGLIYIYQKKYKAAEKTHLKVLNKTQDTSNIEALKSNQLATANLAYIYKKTNQLKKAYAYLLKSNELSELIQDKQKAIEITTIEAKYNQDKARAEEAINTVKERKAKERTQYILAGTGLASLVIILFGSVLYRNSKLKAKNLSLNLVEQELNQQKTLRILQEKNQSKLLNATLDGRETERKEIAQTLHDSVSALLSSANMHLQVVKKKATTPIAELDKSQRIIDEASEKVRDLSHKLISAVLLKFGLEHAVYDMCEKYSNQDLEFELESEDKIPRFEQDFEIKIHNIIEECINNIMKHSKASEASVMLLLTNNTLHITIKDNGVGFDASKISPSSGIGLSQIKARIENMEGFLILILK